MQILQNDFEKSLLTLAPHAKVAAKICWAIMEGKFSGCMRLRDICLASGIASARGHVVHKALDAAVDVGLVVKFGELEWTPITSHNHTERLAIALDGIATYLNHVHIDETEVDVVLTPPERPSRLENILLSRGYVESMVDHTDATFMHIASLANYRFVVMMPFIDETGIRSLIKAWENTKDGVECILITRHSETNAIKAILENKAKLDALNVKVFSYWLQKGSRYETFHAKVLLADCDNAYVGSANATRASLEISMELGVTLKGKGARTVSEIADSILQIANPV